MAGAVAGAAIEQVEPVAEHPGGQMYLGLDQSPRRIGYALGTPDAVPMTCVWLLPPAKDGGSPRSYARPASN